MSVHPRPARDERGPAIAQDDHGEALHLVDFARQAADEGVPLYLCESDRDPGVVERLAPWAVAAHLPPDFPLGRLADDVAAVARVYVIRDRELDAARTQAVVDALERVPHLSMRTGSLKVFAAPPFENGYPRPDAYAADIDGLLEGAADDDLTPQEAARRGVNDIRGLVQLHPDALAWDPRRGAVDEPEAQEEPDPGLQPVGVFLAAVKPAPPVVEGLLHGGGVALLFGREGTHKTRAVLDLGLAIARGLEDWHGRRLFLKGPVAFVLGEGEYAVPTRLAAYGKAYSVDPAALPLHFRAGADLGDRVKRERYARELERVRPVLVAVDTLSSTTAGLDENSKELQPVLDWCRDVHRRTGALVLVVHHAGHKAGDRARGWSGLQANVDAVLRVRRPKGGGDGSLVLEPTKLRAMRPGGPLRLRVDVVELGPDPERPGHQLADGVLVRDTVRGAEEFEALADAVREAGGALGLERAAEVVARVRGIEADSARRWLGRNLEADSVEAGFWCLRLDGDVVRLVLEDDDA